MKIIKLMFCVYLCMWPCIGQFTFNCIQFQQNQSEVRGEHTLRCNNSTFLFLSVHCVLPNCAQAALFISDEACDVLISCK